MKDENWKGKYLDLLAKSEKFLEKDALATSWLNTLLDIIKSESTARTDKFEKKLTRIEKMLPINEVSEESLLAQLKALLSEHTEASKANKVERAKLKEKCKALLYDLQKQAKSNEHKSKLEILTSRIKQSDPDIEISSVLLTQLVSAVSTINDGTFIKPDNTKDESEEIDADTVTEKEINDLANSIADFCNNIGLEQKTNDFIQKQVRQVRKSGNVKDINKILKLLESDLTKQSSDEQNSLLKNLSNINSRVDQISSLIENLGEHRASLRKERKEFEQFLDEKVRLLNQTVNSNMDEDTWATVIPSFNALTSTIHDLRQNESSRESELEGTLSNIKDRIEKMEGEIKQTTEDVKESRMRSETDGLTALPNREAYEKRLEQELGRMNREGNSLYLMVIDIDKFKSINDQYGHLVGDRVLTITAQQMKKNINEHEFLARYGGEEFVLLSPGINVVEAEKHANQIRTAVENSKFTLKGQRLNVTISIGIAEFVMGIPPSNIFAKADENLYKAKNNGRNQVVIS